MIGSLSSIESSFLNDLQGAQARGSRAQRELTSGLRVQTASDDPSAVAAILQSGADLNRTEQAGQNLGLVRSEVDTAESALANAVKLVDAARVAGVQGASTTTSIAQRQTLAGQVTSALASLVSIANTTNNGRYIFSGDSDGTAAYTIDLTTPTPTLSAYQGSPATRQVQDASGTAIPVARSAQEIFDSATPGNSLFGALTALQTALSTNNSAGITTALDGLKTAADYLNSEHAVYGGYQNAIGSAQADATTKETQIRTRLSGLQDADIAQAALEAVQSQTSLDTALAAHSKRSRKSLFDYLG